MSKEDDTKNADLNELFTFVRQGKRVKKLDLCEVNLVEYDLSKLEADQLHLSLANLNGAKFLKARLRNCNFTEVTLNNTKWRNAILRMCIFDGVQGISACFDQARLEDSSVKSASLKRASFIRARLTETTFERSSMEDCKFLNAKGDGVTFRGADLRNTSFIKAKLTDADFRGADLRGANFSNGYFRNADFRGAILEGTLFEGADCKGAMFDANEGPYANDTHKTNRKNNEFTNILFNLLGENITKFPDAFADDKDFIKQITDRIQQASDTFKSTAKHSPEEWKEWIDSFLKLERDKENIKPETIIETLYNGPVNFEDHSLFGTISKKEILNRFRDMRKLLNSSTNEPPEDWKPILEPLMKKMKEGEEMDLNTIIGLFSKLSENFPKK